jgi:HAE1 family hydrophobic/amphiphilic exporter-1
MFLSNLSIKQPVLATMMMVALAVLGIVSYRQLKVDQFPNVDFPMVTITTRYPGASPETIERDVTRKIEEAVNTLEGVKHIESSSQESLSNIMVTFNLEIPSQAASQDVRGKIASIRGDLPVDIEEPVVLRMDMNAMPIISVGVDAKGMAPLAASDLADKVVKRRLETVSGVGSVNLVGEAERESQVIVDRSRLDAYNLTLPDVVDALRKENLDAPAGSAKRDKTEALVRVAARGKTAEQLGAIPLKQMGAATIYVRDVAQVIDGAKEATNLAYVDDQPALALDVVKQSGSNTVAVADGIREAIDKLQGELPPGVKLRIIRDDSTFIRESITDVNETMLIGGALTVLIVFVFLNSWRSTVITGLTLPISVVAAFIAMRAFNFTLNVLTLMGLSLAIGLLIDDAIVVRENIVRHLQRGKDHLLAAQDGTAEIGLAVMATSFTIIAVFIPVAFMGGTVGRFFYEFGITVAAAVVVSLFVSFTLDPMLSSRWIDPDVEENRHQGFIGRGLARFNEWFEGLHVGYERILGWSLDHRGWVIAIAVVAFLGSFPILGILGGDFMPDYNRGEYQISFKTTPGSTLQEAGARSQEVVKRLRQLPDVAYTYTTIGESGTSYKPVTEGTIYVKLKTSKGKTFSEVLREARAAIQDIPGMTFGLMEAGMFGSKPIQISVRGADLDEMDRISRQLMQKMANIRGVTDLDTSMERSKPELRVKIDRNRASDLGISAAGIASILRAGVVGEVASKVEDDAGDSHDVRVRLASNQRRFSQDLLDLNIPTGTDSPLGGKLVVPLREVAQTVLMSSPSTIRRRDMRREVRITGSTDGRPLGDIVSDIEKAQTELNLPPGYDIVQGGDAEELAEMFKNMFQALALAVIFIYLILASQFGSFTHPLSIMLSLPLSLAGVAVALLFTHDTLNIMSMIGLIMLMGLVTKNAILLVDFANQARREGVDRRTALIQAGTTRLRPIMMTTLAMIFGMLPLAFAIGAGAEMRAPMARAVIGGLVTSTLLSLIVVPVVYTYLDNLSIGKAMSWFRRKPRTPEADMVAR